MARKNQPKPLFMLRGEFHDSLENAMGKLIVLMQAVETALDLNQIGDAAKPIVRKALDDMRAAIMSDGD
jgi:hypothetical protein